MWRTTSWMASIAAITLLFSSQARQLHAQELPSLSGRVTDKSTGNALANAEIILLSDSRSVMTDSLGGYVFRQMPVGVSAILIRASQFPAVTIYVELVMGQSLVRPVRMDSSSAGRAAQQLPTTTVTAEGTGTDFRLLDFERRRITGHGQYRNETDIVNSGASTIPDAVVSMRGVAVDCRNGGASASGCRVRMTRAPTNCYPEYVVDGQVNNDFGPLTPIRDIVGIEVYTGPSDVPGEFAGRNSGCGVIVIWTRSGPKKRKH